MSTNLLSKIPVFSELPEEEQIKLQSMLMVKTLQPGEILFREGDLGEHFYILTDGELEILLGAGTHEELVLNIIGPGEYLGEMSLIIPGGERTATARARQQATLLAMSRDEFNALLQQYPMLVQSMVRVLSERLDSTNDATFRDLTEKNRQLQKAYDELKAAQVQLIEKERLERELKVAADIQMSILPDVLPAPPRFDFGARIDPARQVGGDFYDIFRVSENKVAVLIGDVADKGVPSAIFMARAHALIAAEAESLRKSQRCDAQSQRAHYPPGEGHPIRHRAVRHFERGHRRICLRARRSRAAVIAYTGRQRRTSALCNRHGPRPVGRHHPRRANYHAFRPARPWYSTPTA